MCQTVFSYQHMHYSAALTHSSRERKAISLDSHFPLKMENGGGNTTGGQAGNGKMEIPTRTFCSARGVIGATKGKQIRKADFPIKSCRACYS